MDTHNNNSDSITSLRFRLSPAATVLTRDDAEWGKATKRWTEWPKPGFDLAVDVATEDDVAATVKWANEAGKPFLAVSGSHGGTLGLRELKQGVGILMQRLNDVKLAEDGKAVVAGGGIVSRKFLGDIWEMGKMTVAGCCETTGVVAPMLGGGRGFLQGRYGLMVDQLVSVHVVIADGSIVTASETENSDLFWALRGAGHDLGIVAEFEYRVYDRMPDNEGWCYEDFIFGGKPLEKVYGVANRMIGSGVGGMPIDLIHFGLMANNPAVDADKNIVIFFLLYQGPSIPPQYTTALASLSPLLQSSGTTDFMGLAGVMGFSASAPACQSGKTWLRFPASTAQYNVPALRRVYDIFASFPKKLGKHSSIITEAYSTHDVQAVPVESTAFPDRQNNLLMAAFVAYEPDSLDEEIDAEAVRLGKEIQRVLAEGAGGGKLLDACVNYAYGDEGMEAWYGREEWRLEKLRELKKVWDPQGRFGWYCPIR